MMIYGRASDRVIFRSILSMARARRREKILTRSAAGNLLAGLSHTGSGE